MLFYGLIIIFLVFAFAVFLGAPYLPSFKNDLNELIDLSGLKSGDRAVDLGSGDGKVLIALAKKKIYCVGYEINPVLWLISYLKTTSYRKYVSIKLKNFWWADLSNVDGVFVFLIDRFMTKLELKLKKELKAGVVVISYVFKLPNTRPKKLTKNSYIYKF